MMDKNFDVVALGELLIDFTESGLSEQGNPLLEANPGGAPCNVLAMLSKLGDKTAFIGKVGQDAFGDMLAKRAAEQGIDVSALARDKEVHTTLAIVQKLENGDRDFAFYRKPGADVRLSPSDVRAHKELLESTRIFHFGTLSMTDELCDAATKEALTTAKDNGAIITFDPNYRAPLWPSEDAAREKIAFGLSNCDVVKISDNEIELMTGETDLDLGMRRLIDQYDITLAFATLGPDGSRAYYKGECVEEAGFPNPNTIETTGAGDTFCACALHFVLKYGLRDLDVAKLHELLTFANAAASIITTRKGALAVMPSKEEVTALLQATGR